ncbi:MAG: hypothetical protein AB2L14_33320 [Candidatus Xenobiia bacterium LiM19]
MSEIQPMSSSPQSTPSAPAQSSSPSQSSGASQGSSASAPSGSSEPGSTSAPQAAVNRGVQKFRSMEEANEARLHADIERVKRMNEIE